MREPKVKIALLGWGSLLWDKRPEFDEYHEPWQFDGPELPLEFSRFYLAQRRSDPRHRRSARRGLPDRLCPQHAPRSRRCKPTCDAAKAP